MTDKDATYYQLPAVMGVPHRPEGTVKPLESMDPEDIERWGTEMFSAVDALLDWSKEMHSSIYDNYIPQTDRIENMNMVGETLTERPDAIGSRRFYYHRPNRTLYLDVRYGGDDFWDIVFSQDAAIVQLDTTNFDGILSELDADLQHAMDTVDDHFHAAVEITVDTTGFSGILGSSDDEVQAALNTLDAHTHPVGVGDTTVVAVDYYEVQSDDLYLLVTVADDAEVVLPNATTHDGRLIYIKRTMDNQYDVEVTVTGGGLVEGGASFFLRRKYDAITCVAIDDEWYIY